MFKANNEVTYVLHLNFCVITSNPYKIKSKINLDLIALRLLHVVF